MIDLIHLYHLQTQAVDLSFTHKLIANNQSMSVKNRK